MAEPATADPAPSGGRPSTPREARDAIVVAHGDADPASLRALVAARPDAILVAADGGALAVAAGATRIAVLGALGGNRPEHTVANLLLLADPRLDGLEVVVHTGASRVQRIGGDGLPGILTVTGSPGDFISLFPVAGPVTGVRTTGMRFPLHTETLTVGPARGLSNELLGTDGRIETTDGRLLVVITPRSAVDTASNEGTDSP